jgi:hypothetical protein
LRQFEREQHVLFVFHYMTCPVRQSVEYSGLHDNRRCSTKTVQDDCWLRRFFNSETKSLTSLNSR